DARLHEGVVGFPGGLAGGVAGEGVGVRGEEDAFGLAVDEAAEEVAKFWALGGEGDVGPDLVGGVAEPHGVDVAGDDEGVGFVGGGGVGGGEGDGGIEGVGEAIGEEPGEFGVGDFGGGVDE